MWLVSCRRQGMLTQGPAPDPNCKLNISSFLTLPNTLDCLIIIVLLLQMMRGWEDWGWFIYVRIWVGRQGLGIIFFIFFYSVFVLLLIVLSLLVHDSCCVCFFVPFLLSLSLVPLIMHY